MIIKLQKKIWDSSLELAEKSLNRMVKDDSFLQFSSMGMNSSLWWQKNLGKAVEVVLKQLNIPDKESIKKIHQSIFELEKELDLSKDRIKDLEEEVSQQRILIKAAKVNNNEVKAKRVQRKKKVSSELYV